MKIKKLMNLMIVILLVCLSFGVGAFIYNAKHSYGIKSGFKSVPLQYNPYTSISNFQYEETTISVNGGFIKGIQTNVDGSKTTVIRALSPQPSIVVNGNTSGAFSLLIENINPEFYAKSILKADIKMLKVSANSLLLDFDLIAQVEYHVKPISPNEDETLSNTKFIILGDNRDGYDTFKNIIQQVNGEKPAFVIDNGDLVFSGKPNQYRMFDQMVSTISTTICTTLGNHDIRGDGRSTYTKLYGPPYYSFDFEKSHFIFLDSSPGWSETKAISDEQYLWLESDLIEAQGKYIYVISHIPSTDPRKYVTPNEIPNLINNTQKSKNWIEQRLSDYNINKGMDHGFQDPLEIQKFESLMSKYHVKTVFLSHIHSYFNYEKDGVQYLITGGAGAELLTENSYYHYLIAKMGDQQLTVIELPSPMNNYISRYQATVQLFAEAMYQENPVAIVLIIIGLILLLLLLIMRIYLWKKNLFDNFLKYLSDVINYAIKRFKQT